MPLPSSLGRTVQRPLLEQEFTGLRNAPAMAQAGEAMAAPLEEAAGTVAAAGKASEQQKLAAEERRKAMEFQRVLRGGPDLMQKFALEVAQQDPKLGAQLQQEAQGLSLLFQDPQIGGDRAEDILLGFYKGAFDRMGKMGVGKISTVDPEMAKLRRETEESRRKALDALTALRNRTPGAGRGGGKGKPNQAVLAKILTADVAQLERLQKQHDDLMAVAPTDRYSEQYISWTKQVDEIARALRDTENRIKKNALLAESTEVLEPTSEPFPKSGGKKGTYNQKTGQIEYK